jgi:hypothetical protein
MRKQSNFLLLVTLAATATPAFGQTVESAGGAAATAASIPDFSGIWGRNWLFLEPPLSGPGPVVSKLRNPDGTMNILAGTVGDYTSPILTPQAVEVVKKNGEMELGVAVLPNPHNECWPEPTPFFLGIQMGIQLIQQKDKITFLYLNDHQVRYVRMNAPHSAHPTPTWQGESVGHYEGDTLVIDTVGQKVGALSMFDHYGTPFSAALRVIERYRLIDGAMARDRQRKHESTYFGVGGSPFTNEYNRGDIDPDATKPGLQVEITVEDAAMFTTPWSALVTYRHALGEWPEAACPENRREAGWVRHVPQADKPDF